MRAIALGLEEETGCQNTSTCMFDDPGHDGPCASECEHCEGSGLTCSHCHDGLVWRF